MKHTYKTLAITLILAATPVAWTGCVGYVASGPGGYNSGGVWFHDDVRVDGGRGWYGGHAGGAYIHPGGNGRR